MDVSKTSVLTSNICRYTQGSFIVFLKMLDFLLLKFTVSQDYINFLIISYIKSVI